jgi:hypothetical protein
MTMLQHDSLSQADARKHAPTKSATAVELFVRLYRPIVRRAARHILEGRRMDPHRHEAGRFLRTDVDAFLIDVWQRFRRIVADDPQKLPTLGNLHNVFLGALTIAAYHALLDLGLDRGHAAELFADVGWKVYERVLKVPLLVARVVTRDRQRRMDLVLRSLVRFPFTVRGRPGYEGTMWKDASGFHTHWSYCAPLGFVQRYVERHGDRGELEAFYRSWCLYDWPAADLLAGAKAGERGHYERPHTLSRGDAVCDMCWSACPRAGGGCEP